jgi:hypothetical protein
MLSRTLVSQVDPPPNGRLSHQVAEQNIERAGECAEGDHCPRYRCRLCGAYWLGNAPHSCGTAESHSGSASNREQLEETICGWMDKALRVDGDVLAAAHTVFMQVKKAALGEALLDAYGERLLVEVWRERQHVGGVQQPVHVEHQVVSPPLSPYGISHTSDRGRVAVRVAGRGPVTQGTRRVDVGQLASDGALLEMLWPVDLGRLVRLGDLRKDQCRRLQRQHTAVAGAFGRLADSLAVGETVGERWTAMQLEDLVGDTLRAAAPALPSFQRR